MLWTLNNLSEIDADGGNEVSEPPGKITLQFANGATWNVRSSNGLPGTLTLEKGIVNLGAGISSNQSPSIRFMVGSLSGQNGTISMRVNEDQRVTDQILSLIHI